MKLSFRRTVVYILALFLQYESVECDEPIGDYVCKPQEGLALDKAKSPSKVSGLGFCQQYSSCTCCGVRQAAYLQLQAETLFESQGVSKQCRAYSSMLACRVCDPAVGVGLKTSLCQSTCDEWYAACSQDWFAFKGIKQELQLCDDSQVVCSPLSMLAEDGADLCQKAGYRVGPKGSKTCYDGKMQGGAKYCSETNSTAAAGAGAAATAPRNIHLILIVGYLMIFTVILAYMLFCTRETRGFMGEFMKLFKPQPRGKKLGQA